MTHWGVSAVLAALFAASMAGVALASDAVGCLNCFGAIAFRSFTWQG
jgi:hypothetical protein